METTFCTCPPNHPWELGGGLVGEHTLISSDCMHTAAAPLDLLGQEEGGRLHVGGELRIERAYQGARVFGEAFRPTRMTAKLREGTWVRWVCSARA